MTAWEAENAPDEEPGEPEEPIGDVPDDQYGSRVRFSRLKLFDKSPAHYFEHAEGDSSARDKGTAVHSILLKGREIVPWAQKTEATKKSKGGKQAPRLGAKWEAFKAQHSRAVILLPAEYDKVMRMVDAVRANKDAMFHLTGGAVEETIPFDMLGLECRTTPDVRKPNTFTELKTTMSSDPFRFGWQAKKFGYHAQMALHREGIRRAKLGSASEGYIVAVESTAPYPVTVLRMTEKAMDLGEKRIRFWMEQLKTCLSSNQWPGYTQSIVDLDIPDADELIIGTDADPLATAGDIPF